MYLYIYVFSRLMARYLPSSPFRSLSSLTPLQVYTMQRLEEYSQGIITLHLRGREEEGEFKSLFLLPYSSRQLLMASIDENLLWNGCGSPLYLVFTGVHYFGFPLLEVSGEGFTQRLG